GLVVLHDLSLYDLHRRVYRDDPLALPVEVWRNHGGGADPASSLLLRRVVEPSVGVVVDNGWARDEVCLRFPAAAVSLIPRVIPRRVPNGPDLRAELGWDDDTFVLGSL